MDRSNQTDELGPQMHHNYAPLRAPTEHYS